MYRMNQYPPVQQYQDERVPIAPVAAAGLIGVGLGYLGGQLLPGPTYYGPPLPPPGFGSYPYGPYSPYGPGFGYGYPGQPGYMYDNPGFW